MSIPGAGKQKCSLRTILGAALLLAVCVWGAGHLFGVAVEWIWMGPAVFEEIRFDRARWLAYDKDKDPEIRKRMFHDLGRNHLKPGMTRQDVLHLLGKPTPTYTDGDALHYYLGPDAIGIDTNELVVEFDGSGRVRRVTWHET